MSLSPGSLLPDGTLVVGVVPLGNRWRLSLFRRGIIELDWDYSLDEFVDYITEMTEADLQA